MTRSIWNGTGEVRDDEAYFTLDRGEIVGRPYVRTRALQRLAKWSFHYNQAARFRAVRETIDSDAWLAARHGCTVGSIARDVVSHLHRNTVPGDWIEAGES